MVLDREMQRRLRAELRDENLGKGPIVLSRANSRLNSEHQHSCPTVKGCYNLGTYPVLQVSLRQGVCAVVHGVSLMQVSQLDEHRCLVVRNLHNFGINIAIIKSKSTSYIIRDEMFGRSMVCYILHARVLPADVTGNISKRKPV